jgi:hypothetical protein
VHEVRTLIYYSNKNGFITYSNSYLATDTKASRPQPGLGYVCVCVCVCVRVCVLFVVCSTIIQYLAENHPTNPKDKDIQDTANVNREQQDVGYRRGVIPVQRIHVNQGSAHGL